MCSCCYGHLVTAGESFPSYIPLSQCQQLLQQDLGTAESCVQNYVNVPLNNELAQVAADRGMAQAGSFFAGSYVGPWTTWNTVRCLASVGAELCFALALRLK